MTRKPGGPMTRRPEGGTSRTATTAVALHPLLARRWSTRAFDTQVPLTDRQVTALLEAARWAPSANNSQPWRFLVGRRGGTDFLRLLAVLHPGNRTWAADAAALVLAVAVTEDAEGNHRGYAAYDVGQAVAHLTAQAEAEGLAVHQMGGFDRAKTTTEFGLPTGTEPLVVIAVGSPGDARNLPAALAAREVAPRERLPLESIVLPATEPALSLTA